MIELGTPATLMDDQMGHADGSVQARYSHVTAEMTRRLLDGLTGSYTRGHRWRCSIGCSGRTHDDHRAKIFSPDSPRGFSQRKTGSVPEERNPL